MLFDILEGLFTLSGNIVVVVIGVIFYSLLIYGIILFAYNAIFNTKKTFREISPVLFPVLTFFGSAFIAIKFVPEDYQIVVIIVFGIVLPYISTFLIKDNDANEEDDDV